MVEVRGPDSLALVSDSLRALGSVQWVKDRLGEILCGDLVGIRKLSHARSSVPSSGLPRDLFGKLTQIISKLPVSRRPNKREILGKSAE